MKWKLAGVLLALCGCQGPPKTKARPAGRDGREYVTLKKEVYYEIIWEENGGCDAHRAFMREPCQRLCRNPCGGGSGGHGGQSRPQRRPGPPERRGYPRCHADRHGFQNRSGGFENRGCEPGPREAVGFLQGAGGRLCDRHRQPPGGTGRLRGHPGSPGPAQRGRYGEGDRLPRGGGKPPSA